MIQFEVQWPKKRKIHVPVDVLQTQQIAQGAREPTLNPEVRGSSLTLVIVVFCSPMSEKKKINSRCMLSVSGWLRSSEN